jgi:hypothetical protein
MNKDKYPPMPNLLDILRQKIDFSYAFCACEKVYFGTQYFCLKKKIRKK